MEGYWGLGYLEGNSLWQKRNLVVTFPKGSYDWTVEWLFRTQSGSTACATYPCSSDSPCTPTLKSWVPLAKDETRVAGEPDG